MTGVGYPGAGILVVEELELDEIDEDTDDGAAEDEIDDAASSSAFSGSGGVK